MKPVSIVYKLHWSARIVRTEDSRDRAHKAQSVPFISSVDTNSLVTEGHGAVGMDYLSVCFS